LLLVFKEMEPASERRHGVRIGEANARFVSVSRPFNLEKEPLDAIKHPF